MRLKIVIRSQRLNYCVDVNSDENFFMIDGVRVNLNCEDFINKVYSIIKEWPSKLEDVNENFSFDYKIALDNGKGQVEVSEGLGETPDNFCDLILLIQKTKEGLKNVEPINILMQELLDRDVKN